MKNTQKKHHRILSTILVLQILALILPLAFAEGTVYQTGDRIQFGTYPQTRVTNENLISELDRTPKKWASYGYYNNSNYFEDGQTQPSDWMQYADFFNNGAKYRAVKFKWYRTGNMISFSVAPNSMYGNLGRQEQNGYYTDTVYYFKYEPLTWRVLDPTTGYIMCERIIDSQPYQDLVIDDYNIENNTHVYYQAGTSIYANNYATSSIRDWLNHEFYETSFTSGQKANIIQTALNNSSPSEPLYNSATTNDNVFLLSYFDVTNNGYGLDEDSQRYAKGTDYAQCQGLFVYKDSTDPYDGNSHWWLRSPGDNSGYACAVYYFGLVTEQWDTNYIEYGGVRPACRLSKLVSDSSLSSGLLSEGTTDQQPTSNTPDTPSYEENNPPKLNFFQRIIKWFRDLFARLFGRA